MVDSYDEQAKQALAEADGNLPFGTPIEQDSRRNELRMKALVYVLLAISEKLERATDQIETIWRRMR